MSFCVLAGSSAIRKERLMRDALVSGDGCCGAWGRGAVHFGGLVLMRRMLGAWK
jgi:hypothetical protein